MVKRTSNNLRDRSDKKLSANTGGSARCSIASQSDIVATEPNNKPTDVAASQALVPSEVISTKLGKPISERKRRANRGNGALSRGPKSTRGKATSCRNALKHGLLAKEIFLANEDNAEARAEFAELLRNLRQDLNPVGTLENMLVERMAVLWWQLGRVLRYELRDTDRAILETVARSFIADDYSSESQNLLDQIRRDPEAMAAKLEEAAGLIDLLKGTIQKNGYLEHPEIERLREIPGDIFQRCRAHQNDDTPAIFLDFYEKGDPRNHISFQGAAMLPELSRHQVWLAHWKRVCTEVQRNPELRTAILQPAIPTQQVAERILRYEANKERQFYRALDQLERLQCRRRGDIVPPPVKGHLEINLASSA